jgi:hypothetical protein
MPRIALVWDDDSGFPSIVTDATDLRVFNVDERAKNDRVYILGPGVRRVSHEEFSALIAGPQYQLGDKPDAEQAARAMMNRRSDGKADLSVVKPE